MEKPKVVIENYGILASISWNSNDWADHPTDLDLKKSKYEYVKDNVRMHESLNFGHEKYPVEEEGFYVGYTPMFNRPPDSENSKRVNIVFFISSDYHNSNRRSIVGFYGEPIFGQIVERRVQHELYTEYDSGNIIANPENIIYFKNPVVIDNDIVRKEKLLPKGKKISQQGFNYLNSDNVYNILYQALIHNVKNKKLKNFIKRFPLKIELTKEQIEVADFIAAVDNTDANSLDSILRLENKMKRTTPEVKQRISSFIERGAISNKVKRMTGYKCQICEARGQDPYSFKKSDGVYYIESHHIEPVSSKKLGVLSITNIITVCANHHRQLHYGNAYLESDLGESFLFKIEGEKIMVEKINLK